MSQQWKGLHRPIVTVINGHPITLLTIGYVARALGRTNGTIKYWERYGLLPQAAFISNPNNLSTRRRLYPEPYVERLGEIGRQGYVGQRMDRDCWRRFHHDVFEAYAATVAPLIRPGVTEEVISESAD